MSLLLRHLSGESIGRFPVWMMRQAGRYLPRYREIRSRHSFWESVSTPELAAEISLLPHEELSVDATILFSDILTLPYGMGIPIELVEKVGPVLQAPLRCANDFRLFENFCCESHTAFVVKAIRLVRERLPKDNCLIGFAGAPWTVACYLVEGRGGTQFAAINGWAYEDPAGLSKALGSLCEATFRYLQGQVDAGAQVIQVFDTWLSVMPRRFFEGTYFGALHQLCNRLRALGVPVIYFAKGVPHLFERLAELDVDVLGVDSTMTLGEAEGRSQGAHSLQGNLDPIVLLGSGSAVRRLTRELVEAARALKRPPILNLGHGIFPQTPLENAKIFVEEARSCWA